jgi:predicted alpha/beta hydrolase family esterase
VPSPVLILPGLGNSGPQHWQTLWEQSGPDFQRVQQRDWDNPDREQWCAALDIDVGRNGPDTVVVAHSLGCLVVAHWAVEARVSIRAALLVAVPDPDGPAFPKSATGFSSTPMQPLPFKSIVVTSTNDPYGSADFASRAACAWGSHFVDIGARGHINADSGLGDWPAGYELLTHLRE